MALSNLTTPGVYVQEISTLPASVVAVATAIPAFAGYTEKGPVNTPTRITSMPDFEAIFGGAFREKYEVTLAAAVPITIVPKSISASNSESKYILYYHLQMYFANGGGPCYIIAVDHYDYVNQPPNFSATKFYDPSFPNLGIGAAEEIDEITLLVAPEVYEMNSSSTQAIYNAMLAQCNKLKDRFCIFETKVLTPNNPDPNADALAFRNSDIGANFLNYGAAYYPTLKTILNRRYLDGDTVIIDSRPGGVYNTAPNNRLATIFGGKGSFTSFAVSATPGIPGTESPDPADTITITVGGSSGVLYAGMDFPTGDNGTNAQIASAIGSAINNHPVLSTLIRAQVNVATVYIVMLAGSNAPLVPNVVVTEVNTNSWVTPSPFPANIPITAGVDNSQDIGLYNSIKDAIESINGLTLAPGATMAGIYAAVDSDRGVWKAPANVGVTNIVGPSFLITEEQQGGLNVDATSGKSINVIKTFTGRGTLVWGARTLEGNSNEWRYVPVRRLFIMAEESAKKASEFVVFEPNDKNTWLKVKGMISNFLNDLWKQGALAGQKPEDAFFVRVGLGETMTAQDILEGRMIVSIGMAAVRPAEFIVLQFMHKLQES